MCEDSDLAALKDHILIAANRLAIHFSEDKDLTRRYQRQTESARSPRKSNEDSAVERRFKANVELWTVAISTMLTKLDTPFAWRLIHLSPHLEGHERRLTENRDFCTLIDYMVVRRERENCGVDELGRLAQLSVAFQREVEAKLVL
jgi:hypothetical protein